MSLPALLAAMTSDATSLTAHVAPEWLQGRTAYGGLSAAVAYAAATRVAPDLPPLRAAQIAFVGPLAETIRAEPRLLRRGKNTAFVACDVSGETGIGVRALFLFAASRESILARSLPIEASPLPPASLPASLIVMPASAPRFMGNFELASAGDEPRGGYRRWVRLRQRDGLDPAFELIAIADALPPAAVALTPASGPMLGPVSTMAWQVNLVTDAPATTDGWWLIESVTLDVGSGTSSQAMTIRNRSGDAVATATQSVALFY